MKQHIRLPSPAMLVATLALLIALSGTALAAAPVAKRALFANNAGKLQGMTAAQVAAKPSPATSISGVVTTRKTTISLRPGEAREVDATCDTSEKVIAGGFSSAASVHPWDARPADDRTWRLFLSNLDGSAASVDVYAVCVR